jgi:ATP/ADP translocase
MMLFGNKLIKHFGWEFGALMTPVMMAVLALPFFGFLTLGKIGVSTHCFAGITTIPV